LTQKPSLKCHRQNSPKTLEVANHTLRSVRIQISEKYCNIKKNRTSPQKYNRVLRANILQRMLAFLF